MKEKFIFFTLLVAALSLLLSSAAGKRSEGQIGAKEQALKESLAQAAQRKFLLPQKLDMDRVQNIAPFSYYEGVLKRSPFFRVRRPEPGRKASTITPFAPVEEAAPKFIYKGRISSGKRLVVIIGQTRSGEVVMVSRGDNVGGYKVLDITDTEVILSKEGEENVVLSTIERP